MQRRLREGRVKVNPTLLQLDEKAIRGDDMTHAGVAHPGQERLAACGVVEIDHLLADQQRRQIGDRSRTARGQQDADRRLRGEALDPEREQQDRRDQAPIGQPGANRIDHGHLAEAPFRRREPGRG